MDKNRIKIGHQEQADLPIYLYKNGKLVCGKYEYSGKYIKEFSRVYEVISDLVRQESSVGSIDVSMFKPWNAIEIYEEYIAKPLKKSIGAKSLERLSIETQVYLVLVPVREVFKTDVHAKWKKKFTKSDINDPNIPRKGWHLFRSPESEKSA
jgi:hypothetical protein